MLDGSSGCRFRQRPQRLPPDAAPFVSREGADQPRVASSGSFATLLKMADEGTSRYRGQHGLTVNADDASLEVNASPVSAEMAQNP
jgi:hypothetical protein